MTLHDEDIYWFTLCSLRSSHTRIGAVRVCYCKVRDSHVIPGLFDKYVYGHHLWWEVCHVHLHSLGVARCPGGPRAAARWTACSFLPRAAKRKCGSAVGRCQSSVRPSVTFAYCIQMAEDIVKLLFRPGSPIIPVFHPSAFSATAKYTGDCCGTLIGCHRCRIDTWLLTGISR